LIESRLTIALTVASCANTDIACLNSQRNVRQDGSLSRVIKERLNRTLSADAKKAQSRMRVRIADRLASLLCGAAEVCFLSRLAWEIVWWRVCSCVGGVCAACYVAVANILSGSVECVGLHLCTSHRSLPHSTTAPCKHARTTISHLCVYTRVSPSARTHCTAPSAPACALSITRSYELIYASCLSDCAPNGSLRARTNRAIYVLILSQVEARRIRLTAMKEVYQIYKRMAVLTDQLKERAKRGEPGDRSPSPDNAGTVASGRLLLVVVPGLNLRGVVLWLLDPDPSVHAQSASLECPEMVQLGEEIVVRYTTSETHSGIWRERLPLFAPVFFKRRV